MDPMLLIMLVLIVGMFWFTGRSAKKRQKQAAELRASLAPGIQVMTQSGYVGTVVSVDGDLVTLESEPGSRTKWLAAAIARPYEATPVADETVEVTPTNDELSATPTGFVVPDNVSSLITKPGENAAADRLTSDGDSNKTEEDPREGK